MEFLRNGIPVINVKIFIYSHLNYLWLVKLIYYMNQLKNIYTKYDTYFFIHVIKNKYWYDGIEYQFYINKL